MINPPTGVREIYLGIDPGYRTIGYGAVSTEANSLTSISYGAIQTRKADSISDNLLEIYEAMMALLRSLRPVAVGMEQLFFGANVTNGLHVAEARGVIRLAVRVAGVPLEEYTASQVKAAVAHGHADKKQVAAMVKTLLRLKAIPKPDDVTDALAVGICTANHAPMRRLIRDS